MSPKVVKIRDLFLTIASLKLFRVCFKISRVDLMKTAPDLCSFLMFKALHRLGSGHLEVLEQEI